MRLLAVFIFALTVLQLAPAGNQASAQGVALMPNYYYDISVIRPETPDDGDFTIRLTSPAAMTGCFKANAANVEMIDAGAVVFVKLEEGDIEIDRKTTYDQFGCDMSSGAQYTDLTFNKNTLEQNGTNKIAISSKSIGKLFDIDVVTYDNKIILDSELKTGVRLPQHEKEKTITHWFYPVNTVLVFANSLNKNPEMKKQINAVAASRGLTPLDMMLDGFKSPDKYLYFVDTKNVLGDTLNNKDTIVIGNITTSETYQGANGPYQKRAKQAVFVRRPTIKD